MGWELHNAKATFEKFAGEWDQLNQMLYQGHPYYDSRFIGPLLECFASGSEKLCLYRTAQRLTGAVILETQGKGRWATFRPAQMQAAPLLLSDPRMLDSLWSALPGGAWSIEFYAVDPRYAPDFSILPRPLIVHPQAQTIGVTTEKSFAEFWATRPKKLAANIARYFRRAEADWDSPTLKRLEKTAEMDAAIVRYGELEQAGWKGSAGTAVTSDNQQGEFYREVLRRFATTGQARVYELYLGEHLVSSRLVIVNRQMLVCLKTAYDEKKAHIAPGRLLLYRLIEEQFTPAERKTIEFYTNATSEQKEWANFSCTMQNLQFFKNRFYLFAFSLARAWRRRLIKPVDPSADAGHSGGSVNKIPSITAFAQESYNLSEISGIGGLETSVEWFALLEKTIFANDEVFYYFIAEKQLPRLILPVRRARSGLVKKIESLSNYYTPLYSPISYDDADLLALESILAAIGRDHRSAHVMRFSPMNTDCPTYKALLNALKAGDWIPFTYFSFGNWYLKVEGNWEDYLKSRSANLRSSIRRRCKRFASEGGRLEIVSTTHNIERAIADFQAVYSASWKQPEPYPEFVPSLIRCLAGNGSLRLGFARLQDRVIAAQLWYVWGGKAYIYKVAYHEEFSLYSPGTVLTAHLLRHVIDVDHVNEVDFLIGDDSYKRNWMSHRRERHGIVAYNPGTLVGLLLLAVEVAGRLWKRLRQRFLPAKAPTESKESVYTVTSS